MAKRALQRSIAQDAHALGGRANPVVAPQRIGQRQILAWHVAVDAHAARCIWIVMAVCAHSLAAGIGGMALGARGVAGGSGQCSQIVGIVVAVGIVTIAARQGTAAPAQQHVPCLARIGGTAAGRATVTKTAFPGEGIAREQDLVAARAGPVDRLGASDGAAAWRRLHAQKWTARLVDVETRGCRHVFAAPPMTGLAPDANFQKLLGPEALAHGRDPLAQRRGQVAGQVAGLAERNEPRPQPPRAQHWDR